MFSTVILAAIFVGLLLASFVLWVLSLRLGLRWARVPEVTTRRVVLATAIVFFLQVALNVLFLFVSPSSDTQSIVLGLVELAAAVIVPCTVIGAVFEARFLRALQCGFQPYWQPSRRLRLLSSCCALFFTKRSLSQRMQWLRR